MNNHIIKSIKEKISKANAKKIVFVSGNFNIVHSGHIRMLRFARELGDFLLVGVHKTPTSKTFFLDSTVRLEHIQAINFVDHVFILENDIKEFLSILKPNIVVKGKEHQDGYNPEKEILDQYKAKLIFASGDHTLSFIEIAQEEFLNSERTQIQKPTDFLKRHDFSFSDLRALIKKFNQISICVIGDTIIDEYISCDPLGMSQEDPTIVVTPILNTKFLGGAGIVAAHAKMLGANVDFFTILGSDDLSKNAQNFFKDYGLNASVFTDASRPTTLKQRYRVSNKTLLRVNHLRQHDISSKIIEQITSKVKKKINDFDMLIFSDFNYGCLPQKLIDDITALCIKNHIPVFADSQSSSQIGDISRFKNTTFVTPTEREARLALKDFQSGLPPLAEELKLKTESQNIFITLGGEGLFIYPFLDDEQSWQTDVLPALNMNPKDVSGAGDVFLVTSSMAYTCGRDIWQSAYIGSIAAAIQVGKVGNKPLTQHELKYELVI